MGNFQNLNYTIVNIVYGINDKIITRISKLIEMTMEKREVYSREIPAIRQT